MAIAQMIQYCVASLYVASLPGNRYVNGMILGCSEVWGMFFSNILMNNLLDITSYRIGYFIGLTSYLILIIF